MFPRTLCGDYMESCSIVTGRLECLLLDMDFSTQRRREQCRRTNKPSQPLAALQRVKGRRVREKVRDFRFQPVVTCAVSRSCDESDEEEEQDYITDTGMRLHQ